MTPTINTTSTPRPCIVEGRRAIFHRWSDSARPVKPYGLEQEETIQRFQVWNVHAIVEYEDGTVARVWPSVIQFVDGGAFGNFEWPEEELPYVGPDDKKKPTSAVEAGLGYFKRRYMCPVCGKRVATYTYGKEWTENGLSEAERIDCAHCGQAIDWEGVPLPGQDMEGQQNGGN